ncbi:MAG: DNA translocase FtsK 4TM domain-containing protein [Rickettsiales bacterium]
MTLAYVSSLATASLKKGFHACKTVTLLALALFLLPALFSFDPADPSMNRAAENSVSNLMGSAGAYVADPLLQLFGLASYVIAPTLAVLAVRIHAQHGPRRLSFRLTCLTAALPFFCLALSGLEPSEDWAVFNVGFGGVVGDILRDAGENHYFPYWAALLPALCLALPLCWTAAGMPLRSLRTALALPKGAALAALALRDKYDNISSAKKTYATEEEDEDETGETRVDANASFDGVDDEDEGDKPLASASKKIKLLKRKEKQEKLAFKGVEPSAMQLPSLRLLQEISARRKSLSLSRDALEQNAKMLAQVLEDFGVFGTILKARPGPVVTLYELEPAAGTKSSRVIGLADDIARSMSALSTRISVVPGRNVLGIELPNSERETVYLRELLEADAYDADKVKLPLALGKDIGGAPVVADLSRMPHLLVAGTTGSGKSVAVNAMILSLLYRLRPDECKFIFIDPKMLELSVYEGIPHLLAPVVTEPAKAVVALKWAVREMEERYRLMSNLGVRNVAGYNKRIEEASEQHEELVRRVQTGFDAETGEPIYEDVPIEKKTFPFIVIIVDEMADLMLTAGKDIECSIQRLAQMARAAGIHIIMATQRPSVDVITGVIKANFPTRISFQVTSRIDSRTILGEMGAEQLLGMGDMLYMAGGTRVVRVHGPFVDDDEVRRVVEFLKSQGSPEYVDDVTRDDGDFGGGDAGGGGSEADLYRQAVAVVVRDKRASTSYIQRQLKIGYNRAADLIDRMEKDGVVSQPNHAGKREVLQ